MIATPQRLLLCLALLTPFAAEAASFDSCEELFVAPIFLSSHAGTGGEMLLGDAPKSRIEVRAQKEGKKESPEVLVTPTDLVGDIVAIGPLWPESGSPGQWLPIKVNDNVTIRVVGYPGRKETELGKYRIHVGKLVSEHGYALFNLSGGRVFGLSLAVSASDGTRRCKGGKGLPNPDWSLPTDAVRAKPAKAMLQAIQRQEHCTADSKTPECDLSSYTVEYRDVDGDKKVDALILRTLPDGSSRVSAIWKRDAKGDLVSMFEGRCDGDPVSLSPGIVRCDEDRQPGVIDFRKGRGRKRTPTPEESGEITNQVSEEYGQEAVGTLRGVHVAETTYQQSSKHFTTDWVEMAFMPDRGNFYTYYLAPTGPRQRRATREAETPDGTRIIEGDSAALPGLKVPPTGTIECRMSKEWVRAGIQGEGEKAVYTALAVADPQGTGKLDCWSVSSAERTADDGAKIPAGQPYHHAEAKVR